jgi:hypothetical protein
MPFPRRQLKSNNFLFCSQNASSRKDRAISKKVKNKYVNTKERKTNRKSE